MTAHHPVPSAPPTTPIDPARAFSGFAVDDLAVAKDFYATTLGMDVVEDGGMLRLSLGAGAGVLVYSKRGHVPASFTILNFPVADIEAAVDALVEQGVEFLRYPGFGQDDRGINRRGGPPIAWFADPAGNVLSVVQQ